MSSSVSDLPVDVPSSTRLEAREWVPRSEGHASRADALTAGWRLRRQSGGVHEIDDFLFTYYGTRPAQLRRWHPGAGVTLGGDALSLPDLVERAAWRWHRSGDDGSVSLDVDAYLADRGATVQHVHALLSATRERPANLACFGLHEWAMVYRQAASARHSLPLRLGAEGTDAVVEAHQIRCTHFDAFRFFTPQARPLNLLQPTRESQVALEQPGCLHATMDLYKWVSKLGPAAPGDLVLDCFELTRDVRTLDMQASPYDVSSLGEGAVRIETPEGRAEYARRQRAFAGQASHLRDEIIEVCERLGAGR
ncbi:3-methyladenine DNA glycosylase [Sanguibacter antarcticus]|uniref:3-methyladenine DNA glycosylase n=1 Tax=Sanguibacter antarcticus TaxID=372484 RepID=A0A2A9E1I0_9MICO|nr:3-methyladenine DNA glycosylase [Sanguibacter antarcticus]PFG32693.1 hypothetical protein ATL42_0537 [Sanguibacter antarcticus]